VNEQERIASFAPADKGQLEPVGDRRLLDWKATGVEIDRMSVD
jgi:hypothetical protein